MRWRWPTAVALVAVIGVAGVFVGRRAWHRYQVSRTVEPSTALDAQCDTVPSNAERIVLTGEGETLGGAVVGPEDAQIGLVLRQGASQTICDWLPMMGEWAEEIGVRVLLFDRRGRGSSPGDGNLVAEPSDTRIAVDYLRDSGIEDVAVMASSMGNSIMFSALPEIEPLPCAVISISPVLVSKDGNGTVDATALSELTDNVWVAWETGSSDVSANARAIVEQAAAEGVVPNTLAVDTDDHSLQLVRGHDDVAGFVLDAVRSC